jgi:hypothetical protein
MERKDFNVIANGRGYQVQYKGHNIGGAGISREAKGPRGGQVHAQIQDYLKDGRSDIDAILSGRGRPDMLKCISEIDKEEENSAQSNIQQV